MALDILRSASETADNHYRGACATVDSVGAEPVQLRRTGQYEDPSVNRRTWDNAFSLVELVIVLVIVGVIAAIAVPRLTRGATGAGATALKADLAALRNAIELYRAEHEGAFPTVNQFVDQMTKFSNTTGDAFATSADVANGIVYGPYLKAIPPLPVGARKGQTGVTTNNNAADFGWIYDQTNGTIKAYTADSEKDLDGKRYNLY